LNKQHITALKKNVYIEKNREENEISLHYKWLKSASWKMYLMGKFDFFTAVECKCTQSLDLTMIIAAVVIVEHMMECLLSNITQ
jgi:hypothetical protein